MSKTERTTEWVRLLAVISLVMNYQESSATGYSPHEPFRGHPAWVLHTPYSEGSYSTVGKWVKERAHFLSVYFFLILQHLYWCWGPGDVPSKKLRPITDLNMRSTRSQLPE